MSIKNIFSSFYTSRYNSILYETTQQCNLNCLYCYNVWKRQNDYPKGQLDTKTAKTILSKVIAQTHPRTITLTGGEPLLRQDVIDIISFIREQNIQVNIITNGTLLTEQTAKNCVNAGVIFFEIPLLTIRKPVYKHLTNSDSFDKALDGIVNVRSAGGRVIAVFVATRINLPNWEDVIQLGVALGVDGIMFNRFNPGGQGCQYTTMLSPSIESLNAALQIANDAVERFGIPIASSVPIPPCIIDVSRFKKLKFGFCPLGTSKAYFTIDSIGNLRLCNHSPLILGSLFDNNFIDLARSKKSLEAAKAFPAQCRNCAKQNKCNGSCRAAAQQCYGSGSVPEPFLASTC